LSAYTPSDPRVVLAMAGLLGAAFLAGFVLSGLARPRLAHALSWALLVLGTAAAERLCRHEPPGVRMLALIGAALLGMKAVVATAERVRGMPPLSFGRWLAFAVGWVGMQPRLFAGPGSPPLPGAGALVARGAVRVLIGAALVAAARLCWTGLHSRLLASAFLLAGLSFLLHFGLLNVLAGLWRSAGVRCDALFRAPWRSQNLAEFWARRWNLAFSEMTSLAVYRPLLERWGPAPALLAAFLMSGLLHEMAISVPVRAGFGLPLLYFLLHGVLVAVERALSRSGRPLTGWAGRAWTVFWLVAPLPLLFHRPFLAGVVWPLVGIPAGG
jgi:alginate O-acetyltransferase complex protein AlgI